MQTFLPFADFDESAQCLDPKRLGKQRVETYQILGFLLDVKLVTKEFNRRTNRAYPLSTNEWYLTVRPNRAFQNHSAVRMWRGYTRWLLEYQVAICRAWSALGHADTCLAKSTRMCELMTELGYLHPLHGPKPLWLGNEDLHRSHQSNLLAKNPLYYRSKFSADVPHDLPYIWPV